MPAINPLTALVIVLLITSIGQTLFASILLFLSKNGNQVANRFLSAFMLTLSIALTSFFLFDFWMLYLPQMVLVYFPMLFLLPPLLWFYIKKLTGPEIKISVKLVLIHILPAVFVLLALIPFYLLPGIEKLEWYYGRSNQYVQFGAIQTWLTTIMRPLKFVPMVQGLIYVFMSYQCLKNHKTNIENQFSNIENISLRWLKYLVITCAGIYIFSLLTYFVGVSQVSSQLLWVMNISIGCALLSIFGYFGITQKLIYDSNISSLDSAPLTSVESLSEKKYKSSPLSDSHVEEFYKELLEYMDSAAPFLNPELTIGQLAQELRMSERDLSRVINQKSSKNFLEFVNTYRIESAKKALQEKEYKTVLELAMMVGFNSKSAFYETFKRMTNTTPMRYKKELL